MTRLEILTSICVGLATALFFATVRARIEDRFSPEFMADFNLPFAIGASTAVITALYFLQRRYWQ